MAIFVALMCALFAGAGIIVGMNLFTDKGETLKKAAALAFAVLLVFGAGLGISDAIDTERSITTVELRSDFEVSFSWGSQRMKAGNCTAIFDADNSLRSADGKPWPLVPGSGESEQGSACPEDLDALFQPKAVN